MKIETVMLVDDDQDIRKIGKLSLTSVGKWNVILASSGLEALELLERARPDVILLDVMMPEMDGPTTLSKLRLIPGLKSVPVILMTAKAHKLGEGNLCDKDLAGTIAKPFDPMSLPKTIVSLIEDHTNKKS